MTEKFNVYQVVTDRVLQALDRGTVPWHQPWHSTSDGSVGFPLSMSTGKPYRGVNLILLSLGTEYESPWWGTYKTVKELGGQVRKGENGTLVTFWKKLLVTEANPVTGEAEKKTIPMLRYYKVFNADQCDGLPEKYWHNGHTVPGTLQDHREMADILKSYLDRKDSPKVTYGGNQAYWLPSPYDTIHVPTPESYESDAEYNSTLAHEMGHSTGDKTRLNRKECVDYVRTDDNGDAYRPREEMCAELTSAFLLAVAGIDSTSAFDNSASYIDGWRRRISKDPKLVVMAAAQAQKAADYILGIEYSGAEPEAE